MVKGSRLWDPSRLSRLQPYQQFGKGDTQCFGYSNEGRKPQILPSCLPEPNDGSVETQELAERILGAKTLFDAKVTNSLTEAALNVFHYQMVLKSMAEGTQSHRKAYDGKLFQNACFGSLGRPVHGSRFVRDSMPELTPNDPIVKAYLTDIQHLKADQHIRHELGLKGPFQNLLDKAARRRGWTLVPELSTYSGGKRVVPDGTVRDEFRLARGWWEAKDTSDRLGAEIQKKLKAGYPTLNTIFEDTQTAILYQDRGEAGEYALREPPAIADLLNRFFSHDESDEREFRRAMDEFKNRIPDLAQSLREHIREAHRKNRPFKETFTEFLTLCRRSLNPALSEQKVDEMLIQHLLTERLMRNLFRNPEFTQRNVIAAQVRK